MLKYITIAGMTVAIIIVIGVIFSHADPLRNWTDIAKNNVGMEQWTSLDVSRITNPPIEDKIFWSMPNK